MGGKAVLFRVVFVTARLEVQAVILGVRASHWLERFLRSS